MTIEHNTDAIIDKLLSMQLTKFQFGFCSGLKGHPRPSRSQLEMLDRVVARYENVIDYINPPPTDHTERTKGNETANTPQLSPCNTA